MTLRSAAAAVLLAALVPPVLAQDATHDAGHHALGVHVVTMGPDGARCDMVEEAAVAEQLTARRGQVRLTAVNSTNPVGSTNFRIILRATDQLLARPEALLSFRRAAARWERIIQNEITTVIDVDYGPLRFGQDVYSDNTLGSAGSAIRGTGLTPATAVDRFKSLTDDVQLTALYDAIPVPTPSTHRDAAGNPVDLSVMLAGTVSRQLYGFAPAQLAATTSQAVPDIGFNSAFSFDFDPRDGISGGQTDFEGVVVHEIGHTLGFVSSIGQSSADSPIFFPWDLFRVRPDAVTPDEDLGDGEGWEVAERVVTPGPVEEEVLATIEGVTFFRAVQVFFDGRLLLETSTATSGGQGGDGNQASHWRDDARRSPEFGPERKIGIMDPNLGRELGVITDNDIRLLEVIGFSVDYDPPTAEARYALNGEDVDTESQVLITRSFLLGDVDADEEGTATVTVSNIDPAVDLSYEIEFVLNDAESVGSEPDVTIENASGVLAPGASADVTVRYSASGPALVNGTLLLRSNDESRYVVDLPVAFAAGGAAFPTLASNGVMREALGDTLTAVTVTVENPSTLVGLGYTRILEPAVSVGPPTSIPIPEARRAQGPATFDAAEAPTTTAEAQARRGAAARETLVLPGATQPFAITQIGDGRLLISDLNLTSGSQVTRALYLVSSDFTTVTEVPTPTAALITGLAYDEATESVWMADFAGERMREAVVEGDAVTLTGNDVSLGFTPTSLTYSSELNALFSVEDRSDIVRAFNRFGAPIFGYPITIPPISDDIDRASFNAISFREGVMEVKGFANELRQYDQYGRDFEDSERVIFTADDDDLMGAFRFSGYVRSRVDYDDRAFFLLNQADADGDFFVLQTDPPDFPERVGTVLNAENRPAVSGEIRRGRSAELDFVLDTRGRAGSEVDETLSYLVNNRTEPIVTFPVSLSVRPVATEGETPSAFAVVGGVPNPVPGTGGAVRIQIARASEVTVTVFNVLGQRVAVLAQDRTLAAGTYDLPLGAGGLAAGTYLVRVQAGDEVRTKALTVVR